jgi:ATP-dependent DNA ligase
VAGSRASPTRHEAARVAYAVAHIGIEGLVLKRVDEPYVGGVRRWSKLRHRDSAEVLVGALTGSTDHPPSR